MIEFRGTRVTHEFKQVNVAPPEEVFPLLCPVREADWVPGWQYRMIYSQSGLAEEGCVFATPNPDHTETTWIVTDCDPASWSLAFAWVNPGLVAAQIRIRLARSPGSGDRPGTTDAYVRYTYTGLSPQGNQEVETYDQKWFTHKMEAWEAAINHYLRTGESIDGGSSK